ncbi:AraC family transcriptional regulator [uncultured Maricaulis sp.]|uniref:helix-turn-helix domain-containing protein n=1 Tax=uncultured Maricaulis sp. TaxID=174710 RepID=UPI0026203D5F|nr:AraC family transcriptional regulator [uncultured Maricaulis sp.]
MTAGDKTQRADWQGTISSALALAFIDYACSRGAMRERLLAFAQLPDCHEEPADLRVALPCFFDLVKAAKVQTDEPGLPILFAAHADFSEVSIAGLIANASETMMDALIQLNRYARLTFDLPFAGPKPLVFERGDGADWITDTRHISQQFPELVEIAFTYLITGPRRFLLRPHVICAELTAPKPEHSELMERVWACPIHWGCATNRLQLSSWVAEHRVRLQPAYAFGVLTAHADQLLEYMRASKTTRARLEALILPRLHTGTVSIAWAADQLGETRQSIYRALKAEGTTFERVLDELRQRLALEYLRGRKVSIAETAYLLGFAEASPFTRAFKRWTGVTPSAYRDAADR